MLIVEFVLGFILLKTAFGQEAIQAFSNAFNHLISYAHVGVDFVFGGLVNKGASTFFINVLLPITFLSALIGVLNYLRILPFITKWVGWVIGKITGMPKLESYFGIASPILGQSDVFVTIKDELPKVSEKRLFTLSVTAMSTVSMSIVASYMQLLKPEYVVSALVLNLFGAFIILSIVNPYEVSEEEDLAVVQDSEHKTFFQVFGEYITIGFQVATIVAAMLIGFVALMALINGLFSGLFGISFQDILGYVFAPLAFLIGIPWNEAMHAGSLMATKLVTNEFVAMTNLSQATYHLSHRSEAIISVFLVSFANFSSIGIIAGAVKGLDEKQGNSVAKFGLKLLLVATMVSFLSATVVGLIEL
jgi:nucleoside transport protein